MMTETMWRRIDSRLHAAKAVAMAHIAVAARMPDRAACHAAVDAAWTRFFDFREGLYAAVLAIESA